MKHVFFVACACIVFSAAVAERIDGPANKSALTFKAFQKHLREFNYTDGLDIRDMPHLTTYMVHESTLDDPSPLDRVRLIFHGEELMLTENVSGWKE